jgi:hypothetical protein
MDKKLRFYVEREGRFLCSVVIDPSGLRDQWRDASNLTIVADCIDCGSRVRAEQLAALCGGFVVVYEDDHVRAPIRIGVEGRK